ncbi:SDR family NAD(P)-dependent oxidoreductase, partial [Vibrio alfacsensis]
MHIARAFLPAMAEVNEGHIVNIASGAGFMYCPRITVYCASKWAMLGWSQGLRVELAETLPHIKVTTVTP